MRRPAGPGNLPLALQCHLRRLIQQHEIRRHSPCPPLLIHVRRPSTYRPQGNLHCRTNTSSGRPMGNLSSHADERPELAACVGAPGRACHGRIPGRLPVRFNSSRRRTATPSGVRRASPGRQRRVPRTPLVTQGSGKSLVPPSSRAPQWCFESLQALVSTWR